MPELPRVGLLCRMLLWEGIATFSLSSMKFALATREPTVALWTPNWH